MLCVHFLTCFIILWLEVHVYSTPLVFSYFRVWQRSDGLVRIHLGEANVWLEYYGHFATVSVLGLYHGGLCGLCGDHNSDAGDDIAQVITMPCTGTK